MLSKYLSRITPNDWVSDLINAIENHRIPLHYYLVSFITVLVLRYIGEGYSQPYNYLNVSSSSDYWWSFLHTVIGYISLGMGFIALIHILTKSSLENASKLVLCGYLIIFTTPLLDLVLGRTLGTPTANIYIHPGRHVDITQAYLTLFGGFHGMSPGLRIEIILLTIGLYLLFRNKTRSNITSVIWTWICYSWLFFMACSPLVVSKLFAFMHLPYHYSNLTMIGYYSLIALIFMLLFIKIKHPGINLSRLIWNQQMIALITCFGFGCLLAVASSTVTNTAHLITSSQVFHMIMAVISLTLFLNATTATSLQREAKRSFALAAIVITALNNTKLLYYFVFFMILQTLHYSIRQNTHTSSSNGLRLIAAGGYALSFILGYQTSQY